ncbi:hypothetical protein AYJ66_12160 [Dietzia cinnamea]|nr:hypothetical protein AYJ66_12160 [Dietzia cinnamea]
MMSQKVVSGDRAERALRELDDPLFTDIVVRELRRRSSFTSVAGQVDGTLQAARSRARDTLRGSAVANSRRSVVPCIPRSAALQVPHVCSYEAGEILIRRGVLPDSAPTDALRTFARQGRLIVLRGDRRWVYPRFQLDHFDPRRADDVVTVVNRMLDAGHAPEAATVWWTTPTSSLPGRRAPMDLLGQDHAALRELAAAYVTGAEV